MEPKAEATSSDKPAPFMLVGVLGRPGAGKGTQCQWLSRMFAVEHISIGDVLRAEMEREGSPYAATIRQNMLAGTVGPKEVTIPILKSHIMAASDAGVKVFVVDGFPRNLDQLDYFEAVVGPLDFVILLACSEAVVRDRLLPRGRFDDDSETIRRRLLTFDTTTSKVIQTLSVLGKVKTVNAEKPIEQVSHQLARILDGLQIARRQHPGAGSSDANGDERPDLR